MARSGVTEAQVATVADELLLVGERPTIERVRAVLGTGSPNTLIKHLDAWWKKLGARLTEKQHQLSLPDAPPEVAEAASTIWRIALEKAREQAQADLHEEQKRLQDERTSMEAERLTSVKEIEEARNTASESSRALEKAELQIEGLERVGEQQQALIRRLEAELAHERSTAEATKAEAEAITLQLDQSRRQAIADRDATTTYIQAVENRAHQEVDRTRIELASSTKRIVQLEKDLQNAHLESAQRVETLMRELRALESELATLKLKLATLDVSKTSKRIGRKAATSTTQQRNAQAIEQARARGEEVIQEQIGNRDWLPIDEFAKALGQSRQAVRKATREHRLFTIEVRGVHYYPVFQVQLGLSKSGLPQVLRVLVDESGWSKWVFFITPRPSLGGRNAVQALLENDTKQVLSAASGYVEQ